MAAPGSKLSGWEKADILLKGLLPLAVAGVGYWATSYPAERQRTEATSQFYTELLTKREDADSSLRKEMFKYIIDKFLGPAQDNMENQVLGLELLAYNFHDSFDLAPLFKAAYKKTLELTPPRKDLQARLVTVSREIADRQIASLAEADRRWGAGIDSFERLRKGDSGSEIVFSKDLPPPADAQKGAAYKPMNIQLEVLAVDSKRDAVQVRLQARGLDPAQTFVDATFWVSYFDFPMLDNTRLPNRQRLAVVLSQFDRDSAQLTIVYFPETRASLKEKPYFDELIEDMKRRSMQ